MNRLFIISLLLIGLSCADPLPKEYMLNLENYRQQHEQSLYQGNTKITKEMAESLSYFPASKKYIISAKIEENQQKSTIEIPTSSGKTKAYISYGTLSFDYNNEPHSLVIFQDARSASMPHFRDHLFLAFSDKTNGSTSYGGGRYLNLRKSHIRNDSIVLDFNQSYSPLCAHASGFNCPIPPRENQLNFPIKAGESYSNH